MSVLKIYFFGGANVWHHLWALWSADHSAAFSPVIGPSELSLWSSKFSKKGDI